MADPGMEKLYFGDDGALIYGLLESVTLPDRLCRSGKCFDKFVVNRFLDEDA